MCIRDRCKVGVVIEVTAETDFVAKNDKFVDFVKEATKVIMKQNPADVEALMACKTEAGETVDEALKNLIPVSYTHLLRSRWWCRHRSWNQWGYSGRPRIPE